MVRTTAAWICLSAETKFTVVHIDKLPMETLSNILLDAECGHVRLDMLLVCKRWCSVIYGCALFWTNIAIERRPRCLATVELFLKRSAKARLQLSVCTSYIHGVNTRAQTATEFLAPFLEVLRDHFGRVMSLDFKGEPAGFFPLPPSMLHLQWLTVETSEFPNGVFDVSPFLTHPASRIKGLILNYIPTENIF